ncbi:MAG TPA: hypothetical protein VI362_02495 [Ignavibacteriaceae bacterium]|nr:hypothetical protein [Ignavibacteriaceae bacterium]
MTEKEFISAEADRLKLDGIKNFPDDFLENFETTVIATPGKTLFMGNYIFGYYEIITSDGSPVFQVENFYKAKFIVYSSFIPNKKIPIPSGINDIKNIVEKYEKYLDSLLMKIREDFSMAFPLSQNKLTVSNEIFRKLNLVRI